MITITDRHAVEDVKRLLKEKEQRDLIALRADTRLAAIHDSEQRMSDLDALCENGANILAQAYLNYDEEDEPNFERAFSRAHQMEAVERDYDRLMLQWENQVKRVQWERTQAAS